MASTALRRLMTEYRGVKCSDVYPTSICPITAHRRRSLTVELTVNPPEGVTAGPISEENYFEWEALISGPDGTPYEGGVFEAKLSFPKDYPLSPPVRYKHPRCNVFKLWANRDSFMIVTVLDHAIYRSALDFIAS